MRLNSVFLIVSALLLINSQASAEKKPMMISQDTVLQVLVIADTKISVESPQVVLNPSVIQLADNSDMLPDYCLLNARGSFDSGQFHLKPGTLVCVTDDKRILEGSVQGSFDGLKSCNNCTEVNLMSGLQFTLSLENDLELGLQIRADGQQQ